MMVIDQPDVAHLRAQRRTEAARLAQLSHRISTTDPAHARALAALQEAARQSADKLADLDDALAAPSPAEIGASRLRVHVAAGGGQPASIRQAKVEARARLHMVLVGLSQLPEGCSAAAANLRKAINMELARLEDLGRKSRGRTR